MSIERAKLLIERNKAMLTSTATGVSLITGLGTYMYLRSKTDNIIRDTVDLFELLKIRRNLKNTESSKRWTVVDMFQEACNKYPDKEAMVFIDTGAVYTYRQVDEISNKIANWALSEGLVQGDTVGLLMENRPEFVLTWLGLAKIGVATALINTNLMGPPLIHSLRVCQAKKVIVGIECAEQGLAGKREVGMSWYCFGGKVDGMVYMDPLLTDSSVIAKSLRSKRGPKSDLLLIYTSGTTGNPKAGVIKNLRFYMAAMTFSIIFGLKHEDRIYCTLPLYHSAGGMIGVGLSWYNGATLVFRKKFSASNFWSDVQKYNCNVMQYIGELCRYLLAAPPTPEDKSGIRLALGNGLRPDIWKQFQERFGIQEIGEFYASTEGNTTLFNNKNRFAAVGYLPPMIIDFYPCKLILLEDDNETPKRNKKGFCIEAKPGEKGEIIGLIDQSDPSRYFDGYTDENANEKKLLKNVFKRGDKYFRSGDLLKRDKDGFFYFVDRIGDTFRWKGENVATSEVENVVSSVKGVELVNVYGVLVPNHDGRAGMAALCVTDEFDLQELYKKVQADLPSYARPLFLRISKELPTTSTMKLQKVALRNEGFDPSKIEDELYFLHDKEGKYVRVDQKMFDEINAGTIKAKL